MIERMFDLFESVNYPRAGGLDRFVDPDAYNLPAGCCQSSINGTVSINVALEFRGPIGRVRRRRPTVFRAGVPEAAVDEHRKALASEDDVWANLQLCCLEPQVLTESIARPMERRAKFALRLGVRAADRPHVSRSARGWCTQGWGLIGSSASNHRETPLRSGRRAKCTTSVCQETWS